MLTFFPTKKPQMLNVCDWMFIAETLKTLLSDVVRPLEEASLIARVRAKVVSAASRVMTVSMYSVCVIIIFIMY